MSSPKVFEPGLVPNAFPKQQIPRKQKTPKWFQTVVNAGINVVTWHEQAFGSNSIRQSRYNKITNYNLINDIINPTEIERAINTFQIQGFDFPNMYKNYPILKQNINKLGGEERNRIFVPTVIALNDDVVNSQLEYNNKIFSEFYIDAITRNSFDEEWGKNRIAEIQKMQYSYKDMRVKMAQQLIDFGYGTLRLKEEFSRGFKDLLIAGEEIYVADIYGGEPILRRGNPINFFTLRNGESNRLEDSDLIIEDGYLPIGEIINRYHDELDNEDVEYLESGNALRSNGTSRTPVSDMLLNRPYPMVTESSQFGTIVTVDGKDSTYWGTAFDVEGNIRVTRVVWRGMRMVQFIEYLDEQGDLQKRIEDEDYVVKKELGESSKKEWISEWYEGTRIGVNIFVRCRRLPTQVQSMVNPSVSSPGIVGTIMNVNSSKAQSLVDIGKDWQYLYNIFMYKTELAFSKYIGKVGKINLSLKPAGWSMDKYLYYLQTMNLSFEDPFNEAKEGPAKGTLAGNMSGSSSTLEIGDPSMIQNSMQYCDFIKNQVDDLCGVTPQSRGMIGNRETVGGVEQAIRGTSVTTEEWFSVHDLTKARALQAYLEVAKIAWKDNKFKRQFIMDDGSMGILDFDGDKFAEIEYGVMVSSNSADNDMLNYMKQLAQPFIQNAGRLDIVIDIFREKNPEILKKKLENFYRESQQQQSAQAQAEMQQKQMELDQKLAVEESKLQLEYDKLDRDDVNKQLDRESDLMKAELTAMSKAQDNDVNKNGIPDVNETAKLNLDAIKHSGDIAIKQQELNSKIRNENFKNNLESRKISLEQQRLQLEDKKLMNDRDLKLKEIVSKEKIENLRAKTAIKNHVVGEK